MGSHGSILWKKITFFCEKAILESLSGMALSSLERQAFLPSQARRVDIATGHGIAMVYARKGFRSLKDCYKTPVYKHHLCMRFMAALQAAKTVLAYTMAMPHRPQPNRSFELISQ